MGILLKPNSIAETKLDLPLQKLKDSFVRNRLFFKQKKIQSLWVPRLNFSNKLLEGPCSREILEGKVEEIFLGFNILPADSFSKLCHYVLNGNLNQTQVVVLVLAINSLTAFCTFLTLFNQLSFLCFGLQKAIRDARAQGLCKLTHFPHKSFPDYLAADLSHF